jgi:hypothetical protein
LGPDIIVTMPGTSFRVMHTKTEDNKLIANGFTTKKLEKEKHQISFLISLFWLGLPLTRRQRRSAGFAKGFLMWRSSHSFSSSRLIKLRVRQMGAIMYALANIDFSSRLGVVVSELPPDEIDRQDQTLNAKEAAALSGLAPVSWPARDLEMAVFSAA